MVSETQFALSKIELFCFEFYFKYILYFQQLKFNGYFLFEKHVKPNQTKIKQRVIHTWQQWLPQNCFSCEHCNWYPCHLFWDEVIVAVTSCEQTNESNVIYYLRQLQWQSLVWTDHKTSKIIFISLHHVNQHNIVQDLVPLHSMSGEHTCFTQVNWSLLIIFVVVLLDHVHFTGSRHGHCGLDNICKQSDGGGLYLSLLDWAFRSSSSSMSIT